MPEPAAGEISGIVAGTNRTSMGERRFKTGCGSPGHVPWKSAREQIPALPFCGDKSSIGTAPQLACVRVSRLGSASTIRSLAARVLRRNKAEVPHELSRMREAREVANLGHQADRRDLGYAGGALCARICPPYRAWWSACDLRPAPHRRQSTLRPHRGGRERPRTCVAASPHSDGCQRHW